MFISMSSGQKLLSNYKISGRAIKDNLKKFSFSPHFVQSILWGGRWSDDLNDTDDEARWCSWRDTLLHSVKTDREPVFPEF